MRLQASFSSSLVVAALLALCVGLSAHAQSTASPTAGNGTYIAIDPLAGVHYNERYDISLGAAYGHIKAGPPPLQEGANLGGLDLSGSYWFSKHWAVEGTGRAYLGSSGVAPTANDIKGPFVSEYMVAGGPEWLGPHNKHGAFFAHALIGGAYFDSHLDSRTPDQVGFFNNQFAPAAIIGGHIDLNRSAQWVFRITPDALYTRYGINYGNRDTYAYWNFGLAVGVEYKFKKKR